MRARVCCQFDGLVKHNALSLIVGVKTMCIHTRTRTGTHTRTYTHCNTRTDASGEQKGGLRDGKRGHLDIGYRCHRAIGTIEKIPCVDVITYSFPLLLFLASKSCFCC